MPEIIPASSMVRPHNALEGQQPELSINLHDGSEEQIAIIVVHKDKPDYLNITLQSIAVTSFNNNYELIVVDNGSGKESQDYLDEIAKEIKLVRNEKNLYWSAAANKGVQAADKNSKYYVFMHSDVVILNPAWLDILVNVSQSQGAGLVGVETASYLLGTQKIDFVQEWMMLMTKECYEACGPWEEKLPQVGHSFVMTVNAQNKGFKPQIVKTSMAHHYRIFGLDINEYERMSEQAMVEIPNKLKLIQSQAI